ncbi:MAG: chemotaxis protein CheW [Phycisphaerae bacterium]|nr:chemotaxis protein CheW [Phycisphaerae bacterium]
MKSKNEGRPDIPAIIGHLSRMAKDVVADDLGSLAKMHSWCEELAEAAEQGAERTASSIFEQARSLAGLLEALILGEEEDPDAGLASVVHTAAGLAFLLEPIPSAEDQSQGGRRQDPVAPSSKAVGIQAEGPCDGPMTGRESSAAPTAEAADENAQLPGDVEAVNDPETTSSQEAESPTDAPSEAEPVLAEPTPAAGATNHQAEPDEPPYEQTPLKIDEKVLEFIQGFLEEAGEHIDAIETALLEVERAPDDSANIDNLFRPFHTIKGMAGFLNLRDINCLTHEAETIMDQARKGQRSVTPGLIDLVFDVVDVLKAQISAIASHLADPQGDTVPQPSVSKMIGRLKGVIAGHIEPEARQPTAGSPDKMVGENLVEQSACAKEVVDIALEAQKQQGDTKKTGEILVDMGAATSKQVSQAIRAQAKDGAPTQAPAGGGTGDQSIRIDTAKLDSLVDMVGELVIAQTLVSAASSIANDSRLTKDVDQVGKIVRDVQELAMSMRMIPIGATFHKMARLVRDVSRKAGKKVELSISGEDTEMDKNMIQQIGDPLVHMVRNAVDHGVESPEERREAGKDEVGHVHLRAFHQGGNIVIEIMDDGKGLDPKALIAKGIEKGIVQPGEDLTDQQAFALVFAPGFSTAKQVTDISGRGVGMDVVRRNIDQLRGKVEISSELGKGSTFAILLPLTLAIIDGMVIRVGDERFIIPTITIEQALRPLSKQITTVQHKGEVLNVRGRLIPLIQLGALFGLTTHVDPCEAMVVIAHCEGHEIGLVVDELIGQQQVVIKTLGERFEKVQGIAGAAILGDGKVGLILETSGLVAVHGRSVTPSSRARETDRNTAQDAAQDAAPESVVPEEVEQDRATETATQDTADQQERVLVSA